MPELSAKPYLVRALFEWCNDCGYTPYVTVAVGETVLVPPEYVKDGEIVLNISPLATNRLTIGNEFLEFQARFGGVARDVRVPVECIRAIYARETGQGMAFEVPVPAPAAPPAALPAPLPSGTGAKPLRVLPSREPGEPPPEPSPGPTGDRPRLTRVK
ncbi:MAG TPA: ClpXP protease specificity-enhancing factor [Burkholderiaceae bacterium]|nr:ClpXP protease specificity-enhancing factor [Burkholderiaceae bacterium]